MYKSILKPLLDYTFALFLLLIFSPFLLIIGILVHFNLGTPVLFIQERPGLYKKIFKLYKFRTMNVRRDHVGNLMEDKERLTKLGIILRKTSLDELPQLINILKGDLSFIGPRPLLVEYLPLYNEEQNRRHVVKPGITGWAQVNGRNAISWEKKFEYDNWYVDNISFQLDLKIFVLTLKKVILSEGISSKGYATIEKFKGNKL
ncbi:MAG: sugar transferase [Bacteroidales bacterium]|nr:sugar transferase [Bacteroidales bacterium]